MDCSCDCLARMVLIAEACMYHEGVELMETQRRSQLECLLTTNRGFRAPFLYRLTPADLEESWKMPSTIRFAAASSGKLILEIVHKNGYDYLQAKYHMDSDSCINITNGWKKFVSENGFKAEEVVMVMFYREKGSLLFRIFAL